MPVSAAPAPAIDRGTQPAPSDGRDRGRLRHAQGTARRRAAKPAETLRVDIERLDQLMNLAGQLVINKAHFVQIGDRLREAVGAKRQVDVLGAALSVLENMADAGPAGEQRCRPRPSLKTCAISARRIHQALEPIRRDVDALNRVRGAATSCPRPSTSSTASATASSRASWTCGWCRSGRCSHRFHRVIRDITRDEWQGQIRLVISGEKTELDKRMIDELGDPLIHMVRNAADHGIELARGPRRPPASRGKARSRSTPSIAATTSSSRSRDDGKGLDIDPHPPQRPSRRGWSARPTPKR